MDVETHPVDPGTVQWYYSMLLFLDDQEEPRRSRSNMDDESTDNEEIESEASPAAQSTPATQSTQQSPPATQTTSQSTPDTHSITNTLFNRSRPKSNANET
ncbi:uncharacterized protein LOC123720294 [Pieris brassicae]|uniref:uncharacterized protein LOC123720294 n=1 Tax=Pieris brassicae TaxID=7116 RepID=UPI001E65FDCF|nr:uncharacterized protein LOC123720294 [Pieris brassicae]